MTENATKNSVPPSEDLSKAIEQMMDRKPDEEIRIIRVFGDRYRCNWWVREKQAHAWFTTSGTIRRSKFLRVTHAGDKLVIEDLSNQAAVRVAPESSAVEGGVR